jgi:RHS repeat-associated protein
VTYLSRSDHSDQVRSPLALTDPTGELTHRVVAGPRGTGTIDVMDPLAATPAVGFSSTLTAFDAAGTLHMRARDYDPSVGAFTTVDPWQRPDGSPWVDVYQYTDGDPVMFWDPTGLAQTRTNGSTFGWCVNGAIAFIIAFTASGCVAIDTNGGFGVTGTVGAGAGLPEVSATTGPFISSADHVRDLNGVGQWAAAGAGQGVVGGIAGSHGEACNGDHVWTVSPEGGVGLTLPFFPVSGGGVSRTGVLASGGTSCD